MHPLVNTLPLNPACAHTHSMTTDTADLDDGYILKLPGRQTLDMSSLRA